MNRDDVITFALALVAAVVTFTIVGSGMVDSSLSLVVGGEAVAVDSTLVIALVLFGGLLAAKSHFRVSN